jgi:hypothetical protein
MWKLISMNCKVNQNGGMYIQAFWSCNEILGAVDLIPSEKHKNYKTYLTEQFVEWIKEKLGAKKVASLEKGN